MYFYSKKQPTHFQSLNVTKLSSTQLVDEKVCFYTEHYHYNDLKNFLELHHWEKLKSDRESFILYENNYETDSENVLANDIKFIINDRGIHPQQIYIVVHDEITATLLKNQLMKNNIFGVNIDYTNTFLKSVKLPNFNINFQQNKKFSIFSRNYKQERLLLFYDLLDHGLLNDFYYTFNNVNPYSNKVYHTDDIKQDLAHKKLTDTILDWINGIPYTISSTNQSEIEHDALYNKINQSSIHVIIETHFENGGITFFASEKTYKAIVCKKPFLIYGRPYFLKYLRESGYKTFGNFINEEYDSIIDDNDRRFHLVKEIERLSKLDTNSFSNIIHNCTEIVEHNYNLLLEKRKKKFTETFVNLGIFNNNHIGLK